MSMNYDTSSSWLAWMLLTFGPAEPNIWPHSDHPQGRNGQF